MIRFGLEGRAVMVTGGGSGIGRATVLALAAQGARVAVADMDRAAAEEAAHEAGDAIVLGFDVRDQQATQDAFAAAADAFGPLAGLVCSAGLSRGARAEELTLDQWDMVVDSNLKGSFLCAQAAARQMIGAGRGSIVLISSLSARGGHPGRAHYCASKAAVEGLVRDLACEWGRYGVRVNAVAPNVTDTPLVRRNLPEAFISDVIVDRTPLGRMGRAEEMADACLFLLSDAAAYVTGITLPVDGGISAGFLTHRHGADYGSRALA